LAWTGLPRRVLGISPEEATFARRGFRQGDERARERLERVGRTFLAGYHAALEEGSLRALDQRLSTIAAEDRGFAFEGAAMGLTLLDHLVPWSRGRLRAFLEGPGAAHAYMVHVGAGWAFARLPWVRRRLEPALRQFEPLIGWLVVDGFGFHEGYFSWRRSVAAQEVPHRLAGYARRVFDQGLGRSIWFVEGADGAAVVARIGSFAAQRRADLWSGIGLACAYAGGVERAAIEALRHAAGEHRPMLAQGAAFAAGARNRAGNPAAHTELACEVLCGMSAVEAADLTDQAALDLSHGGPLPAYEVWRRRIQARWVEAAERVVTT
jgi:enediyne biosynthesis protein E3